MMIEGGFDVGILVAIIAVIVLNVILSLIQEDTEKKKKEQEKERQIGNEVQRLLKRDIVKIVNDKLSSKYQEYMTSKISSYIRTYNSKPTQPSSYLYATCWEIRSDCLICSGNNSESIYFVELGYNNLNAVQMIALGRAISLYSSKWKSSESNWGTGFFYANDQYWIPYIQRKIDLICERKNIKPLKNI